MENNFNFGDFLLENGFAYSNYGEHQLYELSKDDKHYAVNLKEGKMITNSTDAEKVEDDLKVPERKTDATKWLKGFLK